MIKRQSHPLVLQLREEMYCSKHTREMCLNLHRPLQDSGMQVAEAIWLKFPKGDKTASSRQQGELTQIPRTLQFLFLFFFIFIILLFIKVD